VDFHAWSFIMLIWIRRGVAIVSLILSIALVTTMIWGYRNGICAYWTQSVAGATGPRYWQLDSTGGRIQMLLVDSFGQDEDFHLGHGEKNWNQLGPLTGAAIVARFPANSFNMPALAFERGKATAFQASGAFRVGSSSTPQPSVTRSYPQTGNLKGDARPGVTIGPPAQPTTNNPSNLSFSMGKTGSISISATGDSLSIQPLQKSGKIVVSSSSNSISGSSMTLTFSSIAGKIPYVFVSVNALLLVLIVLTPFTIEMILLLRRRARQRYRLQHNYCLACGYDLSGAAHARCPECGILNSRPSAC
jgi:hypothetical protein